MSICHVFSGSHYNILSSLTFIILLQIKMTGTTNGEETAYPSGAPEFTPGVQWGSCYSIFSFMCMFCRSLFVLLYFFFWSLCCLFFFDLWILITPLVSSNSSYLAIVMPESQNIIYNFANYYFYNGYQLTTMYY